MLSFGFTVRRQGWAPHREQWVNLLLSGLQEVLLEAGHTLVVRVVADEAEEQDVQRFWAAERKVAAFVVADAQDAAQVDRVREFGLPFVLLGDTGQQPWHRATVTENNTDTMLTALEYLAGLGHRRLVWLSGPYRRAHQRMRRAVFDAFLVERGLVGAAYPGDYSARHMSAALDADLVAADGPRAFLLGQNLAVVAQELLAERGLSQPEMALLAWQDTKQCQAATPPISALDHHVEEAGRLTARALIAVACGEEPVHLVSPAADMIVRATTPALDTPMV